MRHQLMNVLCFRSVGFGSEPRDEVRADGHMIGRVRADERRAAGTQSRDGGERRLRISPDVECLRAVERRLEPTAQTARHSERATLKVQAMKLGYERHSRGL